MDIHLAYEMAVLSHAAYEPPLYVAKQATAWGYNSCDFFDCNGTQAYVMIGTNKTVVAFRGTEPDKLQDWATDIQRSKINHPFGKVHRGFDAALAQVWGDIANRLLGKDVTSFYLTGHSLGGALATEAAAQVATGSANLNLAKGLYTFGSPRVGDRRFARTFDKMFPSAYRFVHNNDIVARVPWFGYRHIGELIYLTAGGRIVHNPSTWQLTRDRLRGRLMGGHWVTDGFRDHSMAANYLRILATNLEYQL